MSARRVASSLFVALFVLAPSSDRLLAQDRLAIAVVPANVNNPYFDQAKLGCEKAVEEIGSGNVECFFTGPPEHGGGDEQVQIVADLVAHGLNGIAVSPSNAAAMASVLPAARDAGIPVITWNSDLLPENKDLRVAYIGTHNYDVGVNLAKIVQKIKPNGGTICIQSGGAAAANHNERMQGIRDTLGGMTGTESPVERLTGGERLTGQNGWTEVDGCPLYTDDDFPLSAQQMEDILGKYPDLDAFAVTGGFPMFVPDAYRREMAKYKDRIADGSLAVVIGGTLPIQLDLLKEGLASGLVGERPFEMGYKVIYAIKDMAEGRPAPADPTYTGLDVCTQENVDTCISG
jgi:ribose transport system substrate-binding protein